MRAAGSYRVSQYSNGNGQHSESPEIWEAMISGYCERKGYELAETFADLDVSGGLAPLKRGGFGSWYERRDEFDVLVVPSIDRLSRDTVSGLETARRLYAEGIRFEIVDTPCDMSTAAGRAQFSYVLVGATMYREQRAEDWKRSRAHAADEGRLSARRCPYGYIYEPGTKQLPVPDPDTAPVVREAFQRKASGEALHAIAADFTARAIPTPRGARKWARQTVRRLVCNEFYRGRQTVDGVAYEGSWEPLVSEELFSAANAFLAERGSWTSGVASKLTGLLFCAECESPMYRHHNKPGDWLYRCQGCHKAISAERIEGEVVRRFTHKVKGKQATALLADPEAYHLATDDADELQRLEQSHRQLERRVDTWWEELADVAPNLRPPLRKKLDAAAAELEEITSRMAVLRAAQERERGHIEAVRDAALLFPAMSEASPQEVNKMLKLAVVRVNVHGRGRGQKRIEVEWERWLS